MRPQRPKIKAHIRYALIPHAAILRDTHVRRRFDASERKRIGTKDDPLRGFEAAMERHEEAARAEQGGEPEKAIRLYESSVAEGFVGSQPYERLASLHELRHDYRGALRVSEAFVRLAASGTMPRGAQRSADRKLPWFEARIECYRKLSDKG